MRKVIGVIALGLLTAACGTNQEQRTATGALTGVGIGALAGGPVGAALGLAAGGGGGIAPRAWRSACPTRRMPRGASG